MPLKNTKNKRGINLAKPADEVKSKRFTIKFTESDFDRIEKVVREFNLERMDFAREAIMKSVEHYEKRKKKGIQSTPKEDRISDKTVHQLREAGMSVLLIAQQTGLSTKEVRDILGKE